MNEINQQGGLIVLNPIQIADEESYNLAMEIINKDPDIRDADDFARLNDYAPDNFIMEPVHTIANPIMIDADRIALLWRDRDEPDDCDLMVGIILELEERADGSFAKRPCGIIAGDAFQGILQYRCPCCGTNETGFSMMFFMANDDDTIGYTTRDTLATEQNKKRLFENVPQGVKVSSHDIAHILQHHNHAGHACGHDHSLLPPSVEKQKQQLKFVCS